MRLSRLRKGRREGSAGAMMTALTVGSILLGLAAPACVAAAPKHKYVLRHPKRERCKAHYVRKVKKIKKIKTIKVHRKGGVAKVRKVRKVRKTFCVYVAPKKVDTVPPPAPQPTTTTLTLKPRGCEFFSGGIGGFSFSGENCEYILVVSVADSVGVSIPSPTTTLAFTNAAKPEESWTVPGAAEVGIVSHHECGSTVELIEQEGLPPIRSPGAEVKTECATSIYRTTLDALGHVQKIEIAAVHEGGAWSVVAIYGGSAEYSESSSSPQTL
jgi:hypothetical protein